MLAWLMEILEDKAALLLLMRGQAKKPGHFLSYRARVNSDMTRGHKIQIYGSLVVGVSG